MSARVKLLASVHIAKKELGLDEDGYRAIVLRVTKKHSAGDCTDAQLRLLLAEFRKLGWQKGMRPLSTYPKVRMIYAIWKDIRVRLPGDAGDAELRAFVRRQTRTVAHPRGVSAPEFLRGAEADRVIEGLKGWLARLVAPSAAERALKAHQEERP